MATHDRPPPGGDLETPTGEESAEVVEMIEKARRAMEPPRIVPPLEVAIRDLFGDRFDIIERAPDGGATWHRTGQTWTAEELAASLLVKIEEVERGEG